MRPLDEEGRDVLLVAGVVAAEDGDRCTGRDLDHGDTDDVDDHLVLAATRAGDLPPTVVGEVEDRVLGNRCRLVVVAVAAAGVAAEQVTRDLVTQPVLTVTLDG